MLCFILLAACTDNAAIRLEEAEASAIAESFDISSLIQNAPDSDAEGITVAFHVADEARSLAFVLKANVEFSGYSHDGFTIESGVLKYTFYSSGQWISNYTVETAEVLMITGNGYR